MIWLLLTYFWQWLLEFANCHLWPVSWPELAGFYPWTCLSCLCLGSSVPFAWLGRCLSRFSPGPVQPLSLVGVKAFGDSSKPLQLVRSLAQFLCSACLTMVESWCFCGAGNCVVSVDEQGSCCFMVYCHLVFCPIIGTVYFTWLPVKVKSLLLFSIV